MSTPVNQLDFSGLGLSPVVETPDKSLGQEEFLKLMITQLENQDPFKPMENGEFLGQLAQFGTVNGLTELQSSFASLSSSLVSNQALQAAGLVNRNVLVQSDQGWSSERSGFSGAVDLDASSTAVQVQIHDARGQLVQQIDLGGHPAGLARFVWDGTDASGKAAPEGRYSVSALYRNGNSIEAADTLVNAEVDSVSFGANGLAVQLRGLSQVPFSAVREIG
jgi:flagellar basal-body rod modification protein FlgD